MTLPGMFENDDHLPESGTLVPEADVRACVEWAERQDLLHGTGSLDATFTMTP